MALRKQVRQAGNIFVGTVLTVVGVIALVHAGNAQSRVFAVFVLLIGLAAIYLAIAALRRRT
ncbi:hypothetical protein [Nakamurella panacisegetis]|uniref:hypothetical protein n=1 Tax=Nakamurella panacisegetis TaxID=1090615 RepID=UPI0012FD7626|nr:hypothetical protein [Nakamurella panacisegetis]